MPRRPILALALLAALATVTCLDTGSGEPQVDPTVTDSVVPTPVPSVTAKADPPEPDSTDVAQTDIDLEAAVEALDALATAGPEAGEMSETGEENVVSATDGEEESNEPAIDVLFDYLQAVGLLNAGQYKEAVGRYNVVLRIHPDLYLAYHGRALAYYNEDLFDLALEDFNKAIEYKPDYAEALRNRGVMLGNQGQHIQAQEDLQKAVDIYREKGELGLMAEALTQLQRLP